MIRFIVDVVREVVAEWHKLCEEIEEDYQAMRLVKEVESNLVWTEAHCRTCGCTPPPPWCTRHNCFVEPPVRKKR